jgi:2-dehydro-3-deoxyphosphogluconate aldolase/(4S)-4-hydroxy-2-oxoglutarate aldolase
VKLFPGDIYGPGFVKAIKGPQPWTSIMPTGGVSTEKENLKSWFDAGVTCVGIGSNLISNNILNKKDYLGLEMNVKDVLQIIQSIRG